MMVGRAKLNEFARRHARSRKSLANWERVVGAATWNNSKEKNSEEMKRTFGSVDFDDSKTIFDIGGNDFRLIALVDFESQIVQVTDVMTHAGYNKERWKKKGWK